MLQWSLTASRTLLTWLTCLNFPSRQACLLTSGLLCAYRSDDRLKSNFHRVAMPPREEPSASRYSIAFFNNANKNSLVQVNSRAALVDTPAIDLAYHGATCWRHVGSRCAPAR